MTSTSSDEQIILNELCDLNFQQLIPSQDGKSLDIFLCNKPQTVSSIVHDHHFRSMFRSDQMPFHGKVFFAIKLSHTQPPKPWQKLDFGAFAYKKANWNEINEFIAQHPFLPYFLSNVHLMLVLWYQWLYEILQDFLSIITNTDLNSRPGSVLDRLTFAFKRADWKKLNQAIEEKAFKPFCFSNVDALLNQWYIWTRQHINNHIPKVTKHRAALPPWYSKETSHMMKQLNTKKKAWKILYLSRPLELKKLERQILNWISI